MASKPPTFEDKLESMCKDLSSIVDRLNRDRSYALAEQAQKALVVTDSLLQALKNEGFGELEWSWSPETEAT